MHSDFTISPPLAGGWILCYRAHYQWQNKKQHPGPTLDICSVGPRANQDRLKRNQASRPETQFTLRQHLIPEKTTNWDHPGTTQEMANQHPKEIPNVSTIVDRM